MQLTALFNSAIGKALKVAIFVAVSGAVVAYAKGGLTTREAVTVGLVGGFNSLLVFLQGALDPNVPTVPGSNVTPPVSSGAPKATKG